MYVRHFVEYYDLNPIYGGPTYSIPIQCIGTKREGADMSLVTLESSRPWEYHLLDAAVHVIEINNPQNAVERILGLNFKKYLDRCSQLPDILHFHGVWIPADYWIARFGWNHNIPYVINPRGDLEITRINYNKLKKIKKMLVWILYSRKVVDKAACIIATSEQERDGVRQLGIKSPIAIIPNGIELDAFSKEVTHNQRNKKVLLFLSRVNPIKGLEFLLDAWSMLDNNLRAEWELHIAGNSDPQDYICTLEKKVVDLRLTESVRFVGAINGEAKMRKYQDSNLFILPTLNENFGNVVAEAMMCECPVITTKNAPWSCLADDKCGWWIDLSVENLISSLTEAMSLTDEERYELGRKSRQCVTNRYAAPAVAKKTMAVYRWVLGQGSKPDFVETVE